MTDSMMTRPTLQDLVKEAMAGTISKAEISAEATRQLITQGDENEGEKTASVQAPDHIPTQYVEKLADALGYLADTFEKSAEGVTPGSGPGALEVTQATSSEKNIDAGEGGQAVSADQPPKNPALQAEQVQGGKANTGLETNDDMSHAEQPVEPIKNEKTSIGPSTGDKTVTASAQDLFEQNLERLTTIGEDDVHAEEKKAAADVVTRVFNAATLLEMEKDARPSPRVIIPAGQAEARAMYKAIRRAARKKGWNIGLGTGAVGGLGTGAVGGYAVGKASGKKKLAEDAINPANISADRKSTRLNSSHIPLSRMPSSA